jgi:hypothetical protein
MAKKLPSRIHRPAVVLRELRRLRIKIERCQLRAETLEERAWSRSVADSFDRLIVSGDAVLPPFMDPRPARRARKRPLQFEEPAAR